MCYLPSLKLCCKLSVSHLNRAQRAEEVLMEYLLTLLHRQPNTGGQIMHGQHCTQQGTACSPNNLEPEQSENMDHSLHREGIYTEGLSNLSKLLRN